MELSQLHGIVLFRGMDGGEVDEALSVLDAQESEYKKGETILHAGSVTSRMGLVLKGSVTIESNDMWGNRTILSHVPRGQFFAETYALLKDEPMLVDVAANEDCRILFFNLGSLVSVVQSKRTWALKLSANLLMISARKNLHLSGRSFHTAPKSIRDRVMAYLSSVSLQTGSREFDIPFDRQQLADYLNVERTALSKELGRMQNEGFFTFRKNHFIITDNKY